MADWSLLDREWYNTPPPLPYDPYQFAEYESYYREKQPQQPQHPPVALCESPPLAQGEPPPVALCEPQAQPYPTLPSPTVTLLLSSPFQLSPPTMPSQMPQAASMPYLPTFSKVDNPREIRNKAEKQRRDKLNHSIAELASLVPPVVFSSRKIDKTGVLRYTAHYLRSHQYVFDPTLQPSTDFSHPSTKALMNLLNGFVLTTTYKGLIVVVSQNVNEYLGYTELELLGKSIFGIVHEEDRQVLRDQLMPKSHMLGQNGELLVPDEQEGRLKVAQELANEKRCFVIRFMKLGQRSEPCKYVTCHVEGSLRMSDRACRGYTRCCQVLRRVRARGDNPCSSGNDVVFVGVVRPSTETFINESALEAYRMEYRTRHSIDGEIIQCEQRIALVTGYMTNEVNGINAMNFMHRDEVRWVIIALRDMFTQNQAFGESCYRLMTRNGQFVYLRTRGKLDVDTSSRSVTTFVCTNTLVDEKEGKHLIQLMKERYSLQINNSASPSIEEALEDVGDSNDSQAVPVEDPKQLEKEILHLVTNLPSPQESVGSPQEPDEPPPEKFPLIPPKKERILSAIERIYTVIKTIPKKTLNIFNNQNTNEKRLVSVHSELPDFSAFNDAYLQTQSGSESDINSETAYCPVTSSDFEYVPGLDLSNSCDEIVSLGFNADVDSTQPDIDFLLLSHSELGMPSNRYLDPIPGSSMVGIKRPNRFNDQETTTKKKLGNVHDEQIITIEQPDRESPNLEAFFDEALLNTQIESAMDALEENIDPSFPDMLISKDVEDILGFIQSDPDDKQPGKI